MFERILGTGRRVVLAAALIAIFGFTGVTAKAAEEMNAEEKAHLATVTAYLRGYFNPKIDVDTMAAPFADDVSFRSSDTAPTQHGKAALIESLKKGAASDLRWDIKIVNSYARGPIVAVSRVETGRQPGKPDRNLPIVVGLFIFKDGKISEWYDYVPKS